MPTNRKRRNRVYTDPTIPNWQVHYLKTGEFYETAEAEAEFHEWSLIAFEYNDDEVQRAAWEELKKELPESELKKFKAWQVFELGQLDQCKYGFPFLRRQRV